MVAARFAGAALLCTAAALATAGAASPLRTSTAAPTGQVWAFAFPNSLKSVSSADVDWLAGNGITAIVAPKLSPTSLQRLRVSASRAHLIVIAPRRSRPETLPINRRRLAHMRGDSPTPAAAVELARLCRRLRDRARAQPSRSADVRGGNIGRSRIVALLPLSKKTAWRASIAYASTDPVFDLGVSSSRVEPRHWAATRNYCRACAGSTSTHKRDGPQGMAFSGHTRTTVSLVWKAAHDKVSRRLSALPERRQHRDRDNARLHLQGTRVRDSVHIRARYDAAGNTSVRAEATGSKATGGSSGFPADPPPVAGATIQPGQSWQQQAAAPTATKRGRRQPRRSKPFRQQEGRRADSHSPRAQPQRLERHRRQQVNIDGNAAKVTILDTAATTTPTRTWRSVTTRTCRDRYEHGARPAPSNTSPSTTQS